MKKVITMSSDESVFLEKIFSLKFSEDNLAIDFSICLTHMFLTYFGHKDVIEADVGVVYLDKNNRVVYLFEIDKKKSETKSYTERLFPHPPVIFRFVDIQYWHHINRLHKDTIGIEWDIIDKYMRKTTILKILSPRIYDLIWHLHLCMPMNSNINELRLHGNIIRKLLIKSLDKMRRSTGIPGVGREINDLMAKNLSYMSNIIHVKNYKEQLNLLNEVHEESAQEILDGVIKNILDGKPKDKTYVLILPQKGLESGSKKYENYKYFLKAVTRTILNEIENNKHSHLTINILYSKNMRDLKDISDDIKGELSTILQDDRFRDKPNNHIKSSIDVLEIGENDEGIDKVKEELNKNDLIILIYQDFSKESLTKIFNVIFSSKKKVIYIPVSETLYRISKERGDIERLVVAKYPYGAYTETHQLLSLDKGFIQPLVLEVENDD